MFWQAYSLSATGNNPCCIAIQHRPVSLGLPNFKELTCPLSGHSCPRSWDGVELMPVEGALLPNPHSLLFTLPNRRYAIRIRRYVVGFVGKFYSHCVYAILSWILFHSFRPLSVSQSNLPSGVLISSLIFGNIVLNSSYLALF